MKHQCKAIGCSALRQENSDFCEFCDGFVPTKSTESYEYSGRPNIAISSKECDPSGIDAHIAGAKLDAGKPRPSLVLGGFARALLAVTRIGTYGAVKYSDNGWMQVVNGTDRYDDAKLRHWLYEKSGIECDPDTQELHAAHEAWNALARLDLIIRNNENNC